MEDEEETCVDITCFVVLWVVLAFLLNAIFGDHFSEERDSAYALYNQGETAKAFEQFKVLADQDDADSQFMLGWILYRAEGVEQDWERAVYWYARAAAQDHGGALRNLGFHYQVGKGVPQNAASALAYTERAAREHEDPVAQYNLGLHYQNGWAVGKDAERAIHWFHQSAQAGYVAAQFAVSQAYRFGAGDSSDPVQEYFWLCLAAGGGSEPAITRLQPARRELTAAQVGAAKRLMDGSPYFKDASCDI